jgi:hypothetical protein
VSEILGLAALPCTEENDALLSALVRTVARIGEPAQVLELCGKLRACAQPQTQAAVTAAKRQLEAEAP